MPSAISKPKKDKVINKSKFIFGFTILIFFLCILITTPILVYNIYFLEKVYPNTFIAGIDIGSMEPSVAIATLIEKAPDNVNLEVNYNDKKYYIKSDDLALTYNFSDSVERAYNFHRTGNFILDQILRIKAIIYPKHLGLAIDYDKQRLESILGSISNEISVVAVYPSITIKDNVVQVNTGSVGQELDRIKMATAIENHISLNLSGKIDMPFKTVDPTLNDTEALYLKSRAEKYIGKTLTLKHDSQTFVFTDIDIVNFLDPKKGFDYEALSEAGNKIAKEVNRDPQNPKFEFAGNKVTQFSPALEGLRLDQKKLIDLAILNINNLAALQDKNITFDLPLIVTQPDVQTGEVNNLGIKELIGKGHSTYFHSIPGRVFNVNLAANRINGTLVAPGETFSFVQTLGDVSRLTGYQQAYIISGGKTILGDGGGVCQVSTTLFRAVLNAGLPVNVRSAHAYRVGYYEQNSPPGLDATVYYPTVDFKFTNDTANHILIQAKNDSKNFALVFELYGTKDGREAIITKPVISNYSPPLPPIYTDDPTLPTGTVKQTDYAAAGSKVSFNYKVTRSGQELFSKTFVSNYQPWAAAYLRGTKTQ